MVTIIILDYNGLHDTKKCLQSLLNSTYKYFRVLVVDNGSEKNEAKVLAAMFRNKRFTFLRLTKNRGFSGGNNEAFKHVRSKYVVLLNNDVEVPPGWLQPLVRAMEKDKTIAAVQPKILWLKKKQYFDYSGACGGFIDIFGYPFTRGRIFQTIEKDEGQYNKMTEIFWASGAAMMIRKKILDQEGPFDELFFNYMEEIDLCYRIRKAGYRIICEPKSYVYHKVASTASRNDLKKRFWEHRNNLLFILKNYPVRRLFYIIGPRIFLEYVSILYYLFIKRFDYAAAVLLSQASLLFVAPKVIINRVKNKGKHTYRKHPMVFNKSVVFHYFILEKRRFFQIMKSP